MDKKLLVGSGVVIVAVVGIFIYRTQQNVKQAAADTQDSTSYQSAPQPSVALSSFAPSVNTYTPIIPTQSAAGDSQTLSLPSIAQLSFNPPPAVVTNQIPLNTIQDHYDGQNFIASNSSGLDKQIDADYTLLFGHHAEQAGLAYWEQKIASGAASTETLLSGIAGEAKTSNLEYMTSHYGNAYIPDTQQNQQIASVTEAPQAILNLLGPSRPVINAITTDSVGIGAPSRVWM